MQSHDHFSFLGLGSSGRRVPRCRMVRLTTGGFAVILYLWPMRLVRDVLAEKTVYLGDRLA